MIKMVLGIICTVLGILGVFGFFSGNLTFIFIGGISGLVENIIGISSGQQKSLMTAIIAVIIGIIYSSSIGLPFWIGVLIGLCFESAIIGVLGWISLAFMYRRF